MTTKPSMPAQPITVALPAVPDWAVELTRTVKDGFAKTEANLGLVSQDLDVLKGRVGNLEEARRVDDARATANSIKVRSVSENDLAQEATLADVLAWRAKVSDEITGLKTLIVSNTQITAANAAMTARVEAAVTGWLNSPRGKILRGLLWAALVTWLATKGIK